MSNDGIVLVHGAKKNVGDFLIRSRGQRLVAELAPAHQIRLHPRWEAIPDASCDDTVLLCGGPGLREDFYPRIFRLRDDLDELRDPVGLALGWNGRPGLTPDSFTFSAASRAALARLSRRVPISVRDELSVQVLDRADVPAVMTGCVSWYVPELIGAPLHRPEAVSDVVVTTPADPQLLGSVLDVVDAVRRALPNARITCAFHRDLVADEHTARRIALRNKWLALRLRRAGVEVRDVSSDVERIAFYRNADLHVGFRVHAHLAFLGWRRPSVLVAEDFRGRGQQAVLDDVYVLDARRPHWIRALRGAVDAEIDGFPSSRRAVDRIERHWPIMERFLLRALDEG